MVPDALKHEYGQVSPALQSAIAATPLPPGVEMTSLISGPHVKNSAHFDRRAVDYSLPHTADGWQFVVEQIRSHRWSRIGSTAAVVNDPGMIALARENGVELFHDEGTGSHVHCEVAP